MTKLLIKLFVKSNDVKDLKVRNKYAMLSSITGIIVNILLSIFKFIVGLISNSMSIISDAVNNITDAGSSVVSMIGFKLSQKEIDKDHPWGHGRMEYVAAFIVDVLIIIVGYQLLQTSIGKIIHPEMPSITNVTIILLVVAILVKLWLFVFYRKIANTIDSAAIRGTAYDSISDTISTLAVLISAIVAKLANVSIDGYISILVSMFILFTGCKALKETIDLLLGEKPDEEFVKEIEEFTKNYELVSGIHDIMVHDYGPGRKIVSFHAEVPSDCDIMKAHDIIDEMEQDIYKKFNCITTIHMDPIVTDDEEINQMRELVEKQVSDMNKEYSIHDFRMTDGGEHINLIFDLVVPRDSKIDIKEVQKEAQERLHNINNKINAVIKVEYSYV